MKAIRIYALLALLMMVGGVTKAHAQSTVGNDFWVTILPIGDDQHSQSTVEPFHQRENVFSGRVNTVIHIQPDDVEEMNDDELKMAIAYPNPGGNTLNIRTTLQNARVEVYDPNGRLIHSQALTENVTAIDATDWAAGVYVWKVYAGDKEAESGKWIKE